MKKLFTSTFLLLFTLGIQAQSVSITAGSAQACVGALLDSGGEGGSGYGNNENHTLVLCPDVAGAAISLQWITFNLSTAGQDPIDQLSIYDGNSISAPLIGTYTGNTSPGIVSGSFANTSGCLTLVFTSNATGVGIFAAAITCYEPCEPPTAVASVLGESIPVLACQGQVLTFDASASFAAAGFNVEGYTWYYDDGVVDYVSGAVAQHTFNEPGEYMVQVEVQDDNGCINTNLVDLQVLVSTTPLFNGISELETTLCTGEVLNLDGTNTQAVTWSALPESGIGSPIELPDLLGVPFSTPITFTNFSPGQTLTSANDILSVCVSMEHSFMGDLVISLMCPNGQSMVFHQQGGGGTYLGGANDNDGVNPVIGTCWDYCWSPTATNGTWVQAVAAGQTMTGGTPPSNALIPGTYSSVEPFNQLVGCPLNGTWTFTVVDLWASDNGFLCDWSMNFNPSLFPDLTEFTPVLGLNAADSAWWSGPDIVSSGPGTAVVVPTTPGTFNYTFSVIDNFGCTYDTTIVVTVLPGILGPINIVGDTLLCEGEVTNLTAPAGFETYLWSNSATGPSISVGTSGTYTVTVGSSGCTLQSPPITVTVNPNPQPVIVGPDFSCGGQPVELATSLPYDSYLWSNQATSSTVVVGSGTYTVQVVLSGCPGQSAPFNVVIGSDPNAAFTTNPNSPQPQGSTVVFSDASAGNGSSIVNWSWDFGNGETSSGAIPPSITYPLPGTYPVVLTITTADGCTDSFTLFYVIQPEEVIVPNVFTPNNDGNNDLLVIENVQYYGNVLEIFNRWGNKIFESRNYRNTWRATDVPDGTYYYVLRLDNGTEYTGHLTILR
jgi:gliding motility-associated-like protein